MDYFLHKSVERFFHNKETKKFPHVHRKKHRKEHQFTWNNYDLGGITSDNSFENYHFKNNIPNEDKLIDMNDINNNLLERETNDHNNLFDIKHMPEGVTLIPFFTIQTIKNKFIHSSRLSSYYHKKTCTNLLFTSNTNSPEPTPNNSPEKERRLL